MSWWLWLLLGLGVLVIGYALGLVYAHHMMQRGQSSFLRASTAQPKRHQQKGIKELEHQNTCLEHIADLADRLVQNAYPDDENSFNPETYTAQGDDIAQLSVALLELEMQEATRGD